MMDCGRLIRVTGVRLHAWISRTFILVGFPQSSSDRPLLTLLQVSSSVGVPRLCGKPGPQSAQVCFYHVQAGNSSLKEARLDDADLHTEGPHVPPEHRKWPPRSQQGCSQYRGLAVVKMATVLIVHCSFFFFFSFLVFIHSDLYDGMCLCWDNLIGGASGGASLSYVWMKDKITGPLLPTLHTPKKTKKKTI